MSFPGVMAIRASEKPEKSSWKRRGLSALGAVVLVLVAGELLARFYLGLGDPPLSQADETIEYLFQPNQDCRRFGNHITYNQWSMRATPDLPSRKADPNEFRVLLVGDSILNGGALTDDARLCNTLLQQQIFEHAHRPVRVGNVSAGNWGPANQLAYFHRFGWFDADVIVFVWGSDDYADVPTFEPKVGMSPAFPDRAPWCALSEGVSRYLWPRLFPPPAAPASTTELPPEQDITAGARAAADILEQAQSSGAKVHLLLWRDQRELTGPTRFGYDQLKALAKAKGAVWLDSGDYVTGMLPEDLFRDGGHPTDAGQALIADMLLPHMLHQVQTAPKP